MAVLRIDPTVEHKIRNRAGGGCTGDQVREAVVLRTDVDLHWREADEENERRVVGFATTSDGVELFVALHPLDERDGVWTLRSAWPM